MSNKPIQDLLSQIRIPFLGDNLMRKYENEKSPLRAELYSTSQLEQHAVTLAHQHVISESPSPDLLIRRLHENEEILIEVRNLLIASAKENSPVSPAGEWMLDNFYLIEEQIHTGKRHFPKGYSETLPWLTKGPHAGYPRVYHLAFEIISHADGRIDPENLHVFIEGYQRIKPLKLGELWAIPIMLRLALVENLRRLAAQIAIDRINKNLADYWADKMTYAAETDPKSLIIVTADMARSEPPMVSSFISEVSRRLLGKGPALTLPLTWIEQRLSENGLTTENLVYQESQKQAAAQVSMSNSIGSLRFLNNTDWREFVEKTSIVEKILRKDPHGTYALMDFYTRDYYRHVIEHIAKKSDATEKEVAEKAIDLAAKYGQLKSTAHKQAHVGFYLTGKGLRITEKEAGIRVTPVEKLYRTACSFPFFWYSLLIILLSASLTGLLISHAWHEGDGLVWLIALGCVALFATSYLSVGIVNWLATMLVKPDFLPRLDYTHGIPPEARTLVVVPALFNSIAEFEELLETMEVRFLANRQDNLHFALLTDFKDADYEITPEEMDMLSQAQQMITDINAKYHHAEGDIFYLLHRGRKWNAAEGKWMGYERKRGKLADLNAIIVGQNPGSFQLITGDLGTLRQIRFVITLDADTQLPREAGWKIIATMAHPLNQAVYDHTKQRITEGYGILQPRIGNSLGQGDISWFARIHASDTGIDPYTRAVSDVYQDVMKEGSFIGKGVYDVRAFEKVLGGRFPENRILSHDLLEGCHARSGLISDVQLYEQYPSAYLADMKRRHRWIRGDWQIARWIFPTVPGPGHKKLNNVLSALSRWKIFDNIRRSLVPPSILFLFLYGWLHSSSPWFWTFTVVGILIPSSILDFAWRLVNKPNQIPYLNHTIHSTEIFVNHLLQHVWTVITLPYETWIHLDAIFRTLWRMTISKKKLLQWDPSQNTGGLKSLQQHVEAMWIGPVLGIAVSIALAFISWPAFIIAIPVTALWIVSPFLAWWISTPQRKKKADLSNSQYIFLRRLSRKTWAFFETFIGPEDNWLPPDNFQEYPSAKIAHRTSPTNIGLSLLATLAAHDFGYITSKELLERCDRTFDTMQQLERYKGHFLNWYETQTLDPLYPRYVSSVDSGNLAGSLIALKEGLLELADQPVLEKKAGVGLIDTLRVLAEKSESEIFHSSIVDEISLIRLPDLCTYHNFKSFIDTVCAAVDRIEQLTADSSEEIKWWVGRLQWQCQSFLDELESMMGWADREGAPEEIMDKLPSFATMPSLQDIANIRDLKVENGEWSGNSWVEQHKQKLYEARQYAKQRLATIAAMTEQCEQFSRYEYDFLYDKTQHFLSIGFNVDEHRRDPGFYDLLGSEARLGIYIAIAQGKIPQESWFALGRQITNIGPDPVLISWSGSMFEYLMPLLFMPSYENTLLDQTHQSAVRNHIDYGRKRGLPWGISESCFNMVHANLDYQYRAFGVPGLGLKRGLADDYVVAPYATMMALMVNADESTQNLRELSANGFEGQWGFYESIDYTPKRLQRGQQAAVVKAYMSHHQGMGLLSLAYVLNDRMMQRRFQNDLQMQTSLLLLQEKIPLVSSYYTPAADIGEIPTDTPAAEFRIIPSAYTPVPEVQLLSNGRYYVMVTNAGGGFTRWNDLAVTRWREDATCDNWGCFCYVRDVETGHYWSSTHQPALKIADHYEAIFSQSRAEFRRKDHGIETHTEIVVSPEDDVEIRRVHIYNKTRKKRILQITSYAEVVLNAPVAELLHPSFSNLFVQTEIAENRNAIICTRRPRSEKESPPFMFHLMKVHGGRIVDISYETSREIFIGRGHTVANPRIILEGTKLSHSQGSVLDPVVAIQYQVEVKPYGSFSADLVYGISKTRPNGEDMIEKYQDRYLADRAFELAWTHSHVILRQLNATPADALIFNRLASSIIFPNPTMRAEPSVILKNQRGQSGLWSHSISGDWPIVLLQVEDSANIHLVRQLVQAHTYWKLKGLVVDLMIWNEDHGGYRQSLHNEILSLIAPSYNPDAQNRPGGIFLRSAENLSNEDRILFQTVSRIILSDKHGSLEAQLDRRKKIRLQVPRLKPELNYTPPLLQDATEDEVQFENGLGGFSKEGHEYIIKLQQGNTTPVPWSNVIANPHFGTVISESGQSYTWFQNAHELRLTPWNNDPVTDLGGEHFYIRDEETGHFWSPAPLPARGSNPYTIQHGFGYSVFRHFEDGIKSTLTVFVDPDHPVKYSVLRIKNDSGRARQISATGYVEWVLGDLRHKTMMHIITELDLHTGAIIARNAYPTEFGQLVAFFDSNHSSRTITTDREEFLGRNGKASRPEAMTRTRLSGRTGAALDPCGAIQVPFTLGVDEEIEIVFRMGTGMHMNDVIYLIQQSRSEQSTLEAWNKMQEYWRNVLSVIWVKTPEQSIDMLCNGWLNYQTIACRLWARSGYYQSGGAFGFRDQLQDVLSLLINQPEAARQQILLCASRQFVEGDVQHWWHPPVGRGVRTRCSDDYLWLPYATAKYVETTGDESILDEKINFLESRLLAKGEESYYDLPVKSEIVTDLYDHCLRALRNGLRFGERGLPLIGTGDWNDGMDRVGEEGKGESVWLAWFLYDTIQRFLEIMELRNDAGSYELFKGAKETLQQNIEKHAWDGEWYRRAYFDDGTPLGSNINDECQIDSIAQSWSVISGGGDQARAIQALRSAEKRLVRDDLKIIQLFDPPFDKSEMNPGYIKGYVPGVRENGGQYTHAAIWMIMAFAALKERKKMWELLQLINPILHTLTPEGIQQYKSEPYVIAADVYAVEGQQGRGGWTWYTGSAGWMYQLIIEYVFGLQKRGEVLEFRPCLPEEWTEVQMIYRAGKTHYTISFRQVSENMDAIRIIHNGETMPSTAIPLIDDGLPHNVEVVIG